MSIIDIGSRTIDLQKVESVGVLFGEPGHLRYKIYFVSGREVEVNNQIDKSNPGRIPAMNRSEFLNTWKQSKVDAL